MNVNCVELTSALLGRSSALGGKSSASRKKGESLFSTFCQAESPNHALKPLSGSESPIWHSQATVLHLGCLSDRHLSSYTLSVKVHVALTPSWGNRCPLRFSSSIHQFHLLPPISPHPDSYTRYSSALINIAQLHSATLFIPVSGAGSSVEDSRAADEMFKQTQGRCKTWIQDVETMRDLHEKDRFAKLVGELGFAVPAGAMVSSLEGAMEFLRREQEKERGKKGPRFILKCMGLDENRGDMTLYPVLGFGEKRGESRSVDMVETRRRLRGLKLAISEECPYVFQEFIPGQG